MSDNAVADARNGVESEDQGRASEELANQGHTADVIADLTAPVPEVGDGGPEMVQLLTP